MEHVARQGHSSQATSEQLGAAEPRGETGGAAETPVVVVVLHLVDGQAREIHLISNPEKLTALKGV